MSIETMLAMFKAGVSEVTRVRPGNGAVLRETLDGFHGVSRGTDHRAICVRETLVTPMVSMEVQPKPALLRTCTQKTSATPKSTNPEFKRPHRTSLRAGHWRFSGHRNRCPFICKPSKKGNAS